MIIVLHSGMFLRFDSLRTGETLIEARRLFSGLIVHGDARRDRYDVELRSEGVYFDGTLWDSIAPAVSFGDGALRFHTKVVVDCGVLADGYDGLLSGRGVLYDRGGRLRGAAQHHGAAGLGLPRDQAAGDRT